jgi:hypothetical protein
LPNHGAGDRVANLVRFGAGLMMFPVINEFDDI